MDTRLRLAIAASIALLPTLPLAVQLARFQVMEHRSLDLRASSEFNRSLEEVVPRADILDRNGKILAQSLQVSTVGSTLNISVSMAEDQLQTMLKPQRNAAPRRAPRNQ